MLGLEGKERLIGWLDEAEPVPAHLPVESHVQLGEAFTGLR